MAENYYNLYNLLSGRPEVKDVWYNKKEVKIDGYKFINCRFDNCKLHVTSSNFEFINCFIDSGTTLIFGGDIVKPIRLFNARYEWIYEKLPFFAPKKNPDGTITI